MYQQIAKIGPKLFGKARTFKMGFNLSPMYRRSTARIIEVAEDISHIRIKLPISYKNRNYVGSIFGGSLFSAVDPIPMVQLINLLDGQYVIWDKSAEIFFRAPANKDLYADFHYSQDELAHIRSTIQSDSEMEIIKLTKLTDKSGQKVYCEVKKTLYIASKAHYKAKLAARKAKQPI
ncbi:MAG: DUF4442 domain-containing protein [Pseudomonadota bacterium]